MDLQSNCLYAFVTQPKLNFELLLYVEAESLVTLQYTQWTYFLPAHSFLIVKKVSFTHLALSSSYFLKHLHPPSMHETISIFPWHCLFGAWYLASSQGNRWETKNKPFSIQTY